MADNSTRHEKIPNQDFARLGGNELAYVRRIASDEVLQMFPDAPDLEPGLKLWALLAADGSPILIADSRDAVVANAIEKRSAGGQRALIARNV